MASLTEIFNASLSLIGDDRVTAPDENTEPARVLSAMYPIVRDAVLRSHPWNCALALQSIPADAAAPAFGYAVAYTLPTAPWCLRPLTLDRDRHGATPAWKVVGRKIHTDEAAPLYLNFIKRVTDTEEYDASLVTVLATRLAAQSAQRLGNSRAQATELWQQAAELLREARTMDAQEGFEDDEAPSEYESARI